MTEERPAETKNRSDEDQDVAQEMEEARKHADPSRGNKEAQGGARVSTDDGGNPQE